MIAPSHDAVLAALPPDEARRLLDAYRRLVADMLRGLNAAWAVAHVPGTGLALVGGKVVAFARGTGHARPRGAGDRTPENGSYQASAPSADGARA